MAILAECPICHNKQSNKNKICSCGQNLDSAKRDQRVRYWIQYRLPGGKQRKEYISTSIKEARDADGKRKVQKRENRIWDMVPELKITFNELSDWYKDLKQVKKLSSFRRIKAILANFNKVFGKRMAKSLKYTDLTDYQDTRLEQGASPRTVDYEISVVKTMVTRAFYADKVDGRVLKIFKPLERKLKHGSNARKRILTFDEYLKLIDNSPAHLKPILTMDLYTGMRKGELLKLKWSYLDRKAWFIRLPAKVVKEGRDKSIPINEHVKAVLESVPRSINHDFVFTYRGKNIEENGIKKSFMTACKNAGIPHGRKTENGLTFHDIRRTVKTNMLKAGLEKEYRDTILGHSLKGMDVHYLVLDDKTLAEAMAKYTKWVDRNLETVSANVTHSVTQGQI